MRNYQDQNQMSQPDLYVASGTPLSAWALLGRMHRSVPLDGSGLFFILELGFTSGAKDVKS